MALIFLLLLSFSVLQLFIFFCNLNLQKNHRLSRRNESSTMGNTAGKDAMGHGVGNCHEVGGDSCTGYLNKSSTVIEKTSNSWSKADTFTDAFNTYTTSIKQDVNIVGNGNIVLNKVTNSGSIIIGGRDVHIGEGERGSDSKEAPENQMSDVINFIEIAAFTIGKGHGGSITKNFSLRIKDIRGSNKSLEIPKQGLRVAWGNSETNIVIEDTMLVGGMIIVTCKSDDPVAVADQIYGEAFGEDSSFPFRGYIAAKDNLPLPSAQRIRIAVGEASGPHRIMINSLTFGQDEWNQGKRMDVDGWTHKMAFWAYPMEN